MTSDPKALSRWKLLFWVAAVYNLSAALGACAYETALHRFFILKDLPPDPLSFFYHVAFWFCVLIFGLGYILVALNPQRYPGIVILAILGKLGVFVLFTLAYLQGLGTPLLFLGGVGDFVFALLFSSFYLRHLRL